MKKTMYIAAVLALVLALSGCSLFSSGNGGNASGGTSGGIKITDAYTFEDPEDLTFDTRYVLYDPNGVMAETYSQMGYTTENDYLVVYASEDKVVSQYELIVFSDAESAQSYADELIGQGGEVEVHDTVTLSVTDGDTMDAYLMALVSYGVLADEKPATYVDYFVGSTGLTEYTGE